MSRQQGAVVIATNEVTIAIASEVDIVAARQQGRAMAAKVPFSSSELALIATAISEVARNIVQYAGRGEIVLSLVESNPPGIAVIARDEGPGIRNIEMAMQDGYSTGGGLGLGLPGAKRLMDEFEIVSEVGRGTTITMKKSVR